MQPEISVITPVYNVAKYLNETVNLILAQTFQNFELIIIDDKSTDDTWKIAQNLEKQDSRIRAIKLQKNIIGYIRNYGISTAKGKYIMFIDGDDKPDKTFLEKMYKSITENDTDIAMCKFMTIDNKNKKISCKHVFGTFKNTKNLQNAFTFQDIKEQILSIPNVIWNKIYKKDFLIKNNIQFPEGVILCEDIIFSVLCVTKAKKMSYVDENLLLYRINRCDSASECKDKTFFDIFTHYDILRDIFEKNNVFEDIKVPFFQDIVYTYIYYLYKIKLQYKFSFYKKMREYIIQAKEKGYYDKDFFESNDYNTYFLTEKIIKSNSFQYILTTFLSELTDKIKIKSEFFIFGKIAKFCTVKQKKYVHNIISYVKKQKIKLKDFINQKLIILNKKQLIEKYKNKSELPKNIRLDLSTICQLKCPECYMRKYPHHVKTGCGIGYVKFQNFKKLLDDNDFQTIELSNSGEIFLNPDLIKILEYAYKKNVKVTAYNGVNLNYLTEEQAETLVKYELQFLVISIDGASQESYSKYRIGGNFDNVIKNIEKINYYKQKYKKETPHIVWKYIVFGHNENEIELAKQKSKNLNIEIKFESNWENKYSPVKNKQKVLEQTGLYSLDVNTSPVEQLEEFEKGIIDWYFCKDLWNAPQINWDGKILGCCANFKEDFGGNAFNEGLQKALNNPKMIYAKNMVTNNAPPLDSIPCFRCWVYQDMKKHNKWLKSPKSTGN